MATTRTCEKCAVTKAALAVLTAWHCSPNTSNVSGNLAQAIVTLAHSLEDVSFPTESLEVTE